ncbi:Exodeoxyribonuclease III [hydrothermal vent metagenome]|uniref:Exodeoxyribonuclease III n=1 Tax=hydrothermal vent metagenome TaxID=652676 RepID=A0A3B0SL80_9ZZZZ
MKIATWNVNSVRTRIAVVSRWLAEAKPDVVCLQEIKCQDQQFPYLEFEALGYNCAVHGQKSYNGVAILSKFAIEETLPGLPGDAADEQARYLECVIAAKHGPVRVASIYLPNGNPKNTGKFDYKLQWMQRLRAHAAGLLKFEEPLVLAGDYNVIADDDHCWDVSAWANDALMADETRAGFAALHWLGLVNAWAAADGRGHQYTFWDYQAGAWQKDHGIHIDHILLSAQAADCLNAVEIDRKVRGWEKPSDHVPVIAKFDL